MVTCSRRDLVCLYLDSYDSIPDRGPAPVDVTATGIADALEVGDTAVNRVALLSELEDLQDEGLVERTQRAVDTFDVPRPIYTLSSSGHERAETIRDRVEAETVVVTNGTREPVPLDEIDRYFDSRPLVTALARLTEDGEVPLQRHTGREFVNREAELETLQEAIEQSFRRESQTALVAGASGIGKSTLVRETTERIQNTFGDALVGTGSNQADVTDPYAPFLQAVESIPGGDAIRKRLAETQSDASPDDPTNLETQRRELFERIADDLRALSTDQPIILVVENLQWANEATLELFAHLATHVEELPYPIAFVGTYRQPIVAAVDDHPLEGIIDRIDEEGTLTELSLSPLSSTDTRTLLADVMGRQRFPAGFVDRIHDHTGGNPLFVRETALHLVETAQVDPEEAIYPTDVDAVDLPSKVSQQIDERIRNLDETSRDLLRLGAILGEQIPGEVLATASDLDPATRREYVDLLVDSRIWEPVDGDHTEDLQFVSGSLRDAVVDRLTPAEADDYHARVAAAFRADATPDPDPARLANHLEQAGDYTAANEYYQRAGDRARETYAHQDALHNYEQALALAEAHGSPDDCAAIQVEIAEIHLTTGEYESAREVSKTGLENAPEPSREAARLLGTRADVETKLGEFDDAREAATRQDSMATEIGARDLEAAAQRQLGRIAFDLGEYDKAREHNERSLAIAQELGDRERVAKTRMNLGSIAFRQDDYDTAQEQYAACHEAAEEMGNKRTIARSLGNLGLVAHNRGQYDEAREYYDQSLALYQEIGDRQGEAISLDNIGQLLRERDNLAAAREYMEQSLAIERELGNRQGEAIGLGNLGELLHELGEDERARECYEAGLELSEQLELTHQIAASQEGLATLALDEGDIETARSHVSEAREIFVNLDATQWIAQCDRLRGKIEAADGNESDAREAFHAATEGFESVGAIHDVLETLHVLTDLCQDVGDEETAREACQEAESVLESAPEAVADQHRDWIAAYRDKFAG
jgi:tetratricopeptide (TPR) repeat protein/DNA-binding PadR family transcriptional regulator